MASEQAKKLLEELCLKYTPEDLIVIDEALEAAKAEGRKGAIGNSCPVCAGQPVSKKPCICDGTGAADIAYLNLLMENKCHDPAACPDCASLVAQGREEGKYKLRGQLHEVVRSTPNEGRSGPEVIQAILSHESFRFQPPKVPVPEWFVKWWSNQDWSPRTSGILEAYAAYLKHAPSREVDVEAIVEAVFVNLGYKAAPPLKASTTAAIRKALEGK